jgi:glycosyltransferase involved in cell wall biosynthesis
LKVAIVHDWLTVLSGAESVLACLLKLFPDSQVFTIVNFLSEKDQIHLGNPKINTSFIQKLPFAKTHYRIYLPIMPIAIEQLDLSGYDLIISSSHAVAKGVLIGPDQHHVCLCYSPMRYAWDLQHQYIRETQPNRVKNIFMRYFLHKLRIWDSRTAASVDEFVAISNYIGRRISKCYRRTSTTIYPPVDTEYYEYSDLPREDFYVTASRFVPYKKIDLIAKSFAQMPDKRLFIAGTGPDQEKIRTICAKAPNITLLGYVEQPKLLELLQNAKAFVFAAEEDFGIAPLEAQACGTPVIAYGRGGALETVKEGETGIFFGEQTEQSICNAVHKFENIAIDSLACRNNSERFSESCFLESFSSLVSSVTTS